MNSRFETFTVLIAKINRNIKRIKNQEMAEYDLRSQHVSCLYYLYCNSAVTATDLCEKCEEDKATISRTLDHLEKNGFIVSRTPAQKRYKSPIILTEKGQQTGKEISDKIDAVFEQLAPDISEEERTVFYRNLNAISDCLEKCVKDAL